MVTREFSLQPALDHKERQEEICQMELAEIEMNRSRERRILDLLGNLEKVGYRELERQHVIGSLDVCGIGLSFGDLETLQKRIESQLQVLDELSEQARQKRDELIEITKDKKALEKLKEKHEKAIAKAISRAETKVLDDITTAQFHRRKAEAG
jgi:flagellar protein FliJ